MKMISRRTVVFIIIGLICAVVLIFSGNSSSKKEETDILSSSEEYEKNIEDRLIALISEIKGVSDVRVMVTTESGYERVYAVNTTENEDSRQSEYYDGRDNDALLLKELAPKINGVAVVCNGADNAVIISKITDLISSALGISAARIFVGT